MRQNHRNVSFSNPSKKLLGKKLSARNEVYKALLYSDIFAYPLTGDQLFRFIGVKMHRKDFLSTLFSIPHKIVKSTIYYFLPHHEELVIKRLQREKISTKKIRHVRTIANILRLIPTIHFIGISGSLALHNADSKSDSDLFFITTPHTVWLTRFFVYIFLSLLGVKRSTQFYNAKSVCANMFLDANHMSFASQKRNLYIAHEIIQIVPLVNKNYAYEKFLLSNKWISTYFPNFSLPKRNVKNAFSLSLLFFPLDYMLMCIQIFYMRKKKTRETTTPSLIAFHPIDYEKQILDAYEKKRKKYGI